MEAADVAPSTTAATTSHHQSPRRRRTVLWLGFTASLGTILACVLLVVHHLQSQQQQQEAAATHPTAPSTAAVLKSSYGRGPCNNPVDFDLWPAGQVPMAHPDGYAPRLTAYVPDGNASAARAAVVIAPGGGYVGVADDVEGMPYARWLCAQGIAGYVLHYRCGGLGYFAPVPETDAKRAVRVVRSRHKAQKVGIIGSSAGGHLAATVLAYHDNGRANARDPIDRVSSSPSFGVLVYPVIAMEKGDPIVHAQSRLMLLGPNVTAADDTRLGLHYSIEKHVRHHHNSNNNSSNSEGFPPTFVFVPEDDLEVKPENSFRMAAALAAAKVPHELAVFPEGGHGVGLGRGWALTEAGELVNGHRWTGRMLSFVKRQVLEGK